MINNGLISFLVETGGGFDGVGNPIAPTLTPSAYISCNFNTVTKDYKLIDSDGEYKQATYIIYVDKRTLDTLISDLTSFSNILLQNISGVSLGQYRIIDFHPLALMDSYRITV